MVADKIGQFALHGGIAAAVHDQPVILAQQPRRIDQLYQFRGSIGGVDTASLHHVQIGLVPEILHKD